MNSHTISQQFAALGDETRVEIVELLKDNGELRISEIADQFYASRQSITKHIDILQRAGIVKSEIKGRERITSLSPHGLKSIAQWMSYYEQFWELKLQSLKHTIEKQSK